MKKKLFLLIQIFVGIALIITGFYLWRLRINNEVVNAEPGPAPYNVKVAAPSQATIAGHPNHLNIPSLGMSLPIIDGFYNARTQQWTLTLDKVQYATITTPPNNSGGNTFIYGHYRSEVFARLHTIMIGAQAIINTDNNHKFTYQLEKVDVVPPTDDSLFFYQGSPILTIQTCTGTFFQNRQLFTFKLIQAV